MLTLLSLASLLLALDAPAAAAAAPAPAAATIPAGTKIAVHVTSMLSSHDMRTDQKFTFFIDQDLTVGGAVVAGKCAHGTGTVTLAGKHGINGHEGNLRLRFDTLTAIDGTQIKLAGDEQIFNGKNRKATAFFTTRYINGDDVEVKPETPLTVVVLDNTPIGAALPGPAAVCPSADATPSPAQ